MRLAVILFIVFYTNSMNVFGVPLAYIYKAVFIIFFLTLNLFESFERKSFLLSFLVVLVMCLNRDVFSFTFNSMMAILNWLMLFLCVKAFERKSIRLPMLRATPYLAVLCVLPFLMGLPSMVKQDRGLEQFGGSGFRLLGPFENSHTFGFALSILLVIQLFFIHKKGADFKRIVIVIIATIGIYLSYTRTIWLGLLLGLLAVLKVNSISFRKLIFPSLIFSIVFFYSWSTDSVFKSRILDTRVENSRDDFIMEMGSGRGRLWYGTYVNFKESTALHQIFGYGVETSQENLKLRIGQKLKPHNGILQILIEYGILGLLAVSLKFRMFNAASGIGKLPALIIFFSFFMFQGTINYVVALFFALIINLDVKDIYTVA